MKGMELVGYKLHEDEIDSSYTRIHYLMKDSNGDTWKCDHICPNNYVKEFINRMPKAVMGMSVPRPMSPPVITKPKRSKEEVQAKLDKAEKKRQMRRDKRKGLMEQQS